MPARSVHVMQLSSHIRLIHTTLPNPMRTFFTNEESLLINTQFVITARILEEDAHVNVLHASCYTYLKE